MRVYGLEQLTRDIMAENDLACVALPRKAWELCRDQLQAINGPYDWRNHGGMTTLRSFWFQGVRIRVLEGPL